ncbi:MAG: preprotein translocase subunit Sec61beta [Candidatus Micrarchaeota archaeon]
MSDDHRLSTPSSSTGIIRFYDVKSSNIQVEPQLVVAMLAIFLALELLLQAVRF